MCGFVVILNRDPQRPVDEALLGRMTDALSHRGPDDRALELRGHVGFGFRRLSIQDLSEAGRQPMSRAGRTLVFNGEIYDFQARRRELEGQGERFSGRSDAEVLLASLVREGVEPALKRARGMFALATWDGARLTLARDRAGQKPLYVWQGPERVVAASELKALLVDPALERRLDPAALAGYLTFLTVPEPHAVIAGVEKLTPGTYLELDRAGREVRRSRYWDPLELSARSAPRESLAAAGARLRGHLEQAIRTHLVADVPVGAFLSGGIDSAGVAALAQAELRRRGEGPLKTFCVAFRGSPLDESELAARTARALGTEHRRIDVTPRLGDDLPGIAWHLDEPFGMASSAAIYYLARETRRHVTVALSGDAADEIFGGYPWRHAWLTPHQLVGRVPRLVRRALGRLAPGHGQDLGGPDGGGVTGRRARALKWLGALGREDAGIYADLMCGFRRGEVAALLDPELARGAGSPTARFEAAFQALPRGDGVQRGLLAELQTTLCHEMLAKVDRMSMAFGLEVRLPYLDDEVLAAALALPSRHKVGARLGKRALRAALAPLLPAEVFQRPKRGFTVPLGEWFRGPLRELAEDALGSLGRRGFLREAAVRGVLAQHLRGPYDRGAQVYALVALETWCRAYLDRPEVARAPARAAQLSER